VSIFFRRNTMYSKAKYAVVGFVVLLGLFWAHVPPQMSGNFDFAVWEQPRVKACILGDDDNDMDKILAGHCTHFMLDKSLKGRGEVAACNAVVDQSTWAKNFSIENETVQVAESAKEAMGDAIQTEEASQLSGEVEMLQGRVDMWMSLTAGVALATALSVRRAAVASRRLQKQMATTQEEAACVQRVLQEERRSFLEDKGQLTSEVAKLTSQIASVEREKQWMKKQMTKRKEEAAELHSSRKENLRLTNEVTHLQSKLEELAHVRETLEATMIQHQKGAVIAQEAWESEQRRFEGENVRLSGEAASLLSRIEKIQQEKATTEEHFATLQQAVTTAQAVQKEERRRFLDEKSRLSADIAELMGLLSERDIRRKELWLARYLLKQGSEKWRSMLSEAMLSSATELDLQGNRLGDEGVKVVADVLKLNQTLRSLKLQGNNIGPKGAKALADGIVVNNTVHSINLDRNCLEDEGAATLFDALQSNTALHELLLGRNSIGDAGCIGLTEGLETNTSLVKMCLPQNRIGLSGAKALAKMLDGNTSLLSLDFEWNPCFIEPQGAELRQSINIALARNRQIDQPTGCSCCDARGRR